MLIKRYIVDNQIENLFVKVISSNFIIKDASNIRNIYYTSLYLFYFFHSYFTSM